MSTEPTPTPQGNERTSGTPRLPPPVPDHELIRCIGSGSYGEVWLARNVTGTYRAVKIVYRGTFEEERPYEREFGGIQKFEPISRSHESQLNILHVGRNDADGYFYYLMELADDAGAGPVPSPSAAREASAPPFNPASYAPKTLKSEIRRRGRLPADECIDIILALTTALAHLHKSGLVHRDIKPSNIVYVNGRPKLADIGLVTGVDATRSYVGTEGFAPPEGPGSPPADIYALGKVLYEMSTGRDRQEFPELPSRLGGSENDENALLELNEVILKACALEPGRRYQTADAIRADLQLLRDGQSLAQKRATRRRLKRLFQASGVVVGLAAIVAVVNEIRYRRQEAALAAAMYTPASGSTSPARGSSNTPAKPKNELPDASRQFADFEDAIRARGETYTRIDVGREVGKCAFTTVRLNERPTRWGNVYFDAVRFTAPNEKELDMAWAFIFPNVRFSWSIILVEGEMDRGFRHFSSMPAKAYRIPQEAEAKTITIQGLLGKWIEPKRDYLIIFRFLEHRPVDFQVAINFVPTGLCSETNRTSLETALGLVLKETESETATSREPAQK